MSASRFSSAARTALAAGAVAAVVGAVVALANLGPTTAEPGSASSPSASSATSPAPPGPAGAVELFAPATAGDVAQETVVDPGGAWPISGCPSPTGPGTDRVAFVVGTERGPEYAQARAIGWYTDSAAAEAAYRAIVQAVRGCGSAGTPVESAAVPLGAAGVSAIVAGAESGGVVEVASYAISWSAETVVLASDNSTFHVGSIPAPGEVSTTIAGAQRLLDEVCRVDATRC